MCSSTAAVQGPRKDAAAAALYEYIVVSYVISSYRDVTDVVDVRYYDELQMYSQEILPSLTYWTYLKQQAVTRHFNYVIIPCSRASSM